MTLATNKLYDAFAYAGSHSSQILVHSATNKISPYPNPSPPIPNVYYLKNITILSLKLTNC